MKKIHIESESIFFGFAFVPWQTQLLPFERWKWKSTKLIGLYENIQRSSWKTMQIRNTFVSHVGVELSAAHRNEQVWKVSFMRTNHFCVRHNFSADAIFQWTFLFWKQTPANRPDQRTIESFCDDRRHIGKFFFFLLQSVSLFCETMIINIKWGKGVAGNSTYFYSVRCCCASSQFTHTQGIFFIFSLMA